LPRTDIPAEPTNPPTHRTKREKMENPIIPVALSLPWPWLAPSLCASLSRNQQRWLKKSRGEDCRRAIGHAHECLGIKKRRSPQVSLSTSPLLPDGPVGNRAGQETEAVLCLSKSPQIGPINSPSKGGDVDGTGSPSFQKPTKPAKPTVAALTRTPSSRSETVSRSPL